MTTTSAVKKTIVERTAMATVRASLETRTVPRIRELRSPVRALLQVGCARPGEPRLLQLLDRPLRHSRASALFTHAVSFDPFWRTSPNRSFVPLVGSLPTIFPSDSCTAVT